MLRDRKTELMGEAVIFYCLACGWQSEPEAHMAPTSYCGFCDAPLRHFVKYEAGVEDAAAKAAVAGHLSSAGGWMLRSMRRRNRAGQ